MLKASIDIGSNTTLLLIAEVEGAEILVREDHSQITALGKGIDAQNMFAEASMQATYEALSAYVNIAQKYHIAASQIIVTATEASRVAKNAPEFYQRIKNDLGLTIQIISSQAEAFYTALGVCLMSKMTARESFSILDIGGASSEVIRVIPHPFQLVESISLPIGSVRALEWMTSGKWHDHWIKLFAAYELKPYRTDTLVCVAGSMTAIGAMLKGLQTFDAQLVDGTSVATSKLAEFVDKLKDKNPDDLLASYPFLGKRSETIAAGAQAAFKIITALGVERLVISTSGLRHGTIYQGVNHV